MDLSNPLVVIALAIVANAVISAGTFANMLSLRSRIASLYVKISGMDADNQVDPDEVKAGIEGMKDIIEDFRKPQV